CARQDSNLDFW
nr:immunoglobulin heavy chain junction region [Macaca mulatta]MOV52333.1 immunoglobulin heavy chain junction region [Macaca mulatta]MOV52347.1 immunoglobulin heavy chain junction region [Macaca mulatta]MOV52711.1 immunoglobulin heavy chain junction region [Macaca mulatta]MOV53104.1 immunoglobulin heavy chain junction region [Macaca mulatta]